MLKPVMAWITAFVLCASLIAIDVFYLQSLLSVLGFGLLLGYWVMPRIVYFINKYVARPMFVSHMRATLNTFKRRTLRSTKMFIDGDYFDLDMMDGQQKLNLIMNIAANGREPNDIAVEHLKEMHGIFTTMVTMVEDMLKERGA